VAGEHLDTMLADAVTMLRAVRIPHMPGEMPALWQVPGTARSFTSLDLVGEALNRIAKDDRG
jgi:hypothetical protein